MIVFKCNELPNREFETKQEMFKELKANKTLLIDSKKSTIKNSDSIKCTPVKDLSTIKGVEVSEGETIAVINTTLYKDSHNDVHLNGIWNKSISEQVGKIYYVTDHEISVQTVIIPKEDLTMMLEMVSWKDLGADFDGETQALMFKFKDSEVMNQAAKRIIENKKESENSIRMQYVKLELAINDSSEEFKEEKRIWDTNINSIANKAETEENGFFWAVEEAKIYREGSMVLAGSNDITPMIYSNKNNEPLKDTQKEEPLKDTPTKLTINKFI